ncbi:MAG: ATP-binding protein [Patescibacteria group bacterium]|nr:ATP-binding protein [Patescibacteria group bacterium]
MATLEGDPRKHFVVSESVERSRGKSIGEDLDRGNFQECSGVAIQTGDILSEMDILGVTDWMSKGFYDYYSRLPINRDNLRMMLFLLSTFAIAEGIKNAVAHGNNYDSQKKVIVTWALSENIAVSIIDEGKEEIDLTPKEIIIDPDLLEELIAGGGNGVKHIKRTTERLGGQAVWNPLYNKEGQKDGTELRITVPVLPWIL